MTEPSIDDIENQAFKLAKRIVPTPILTWTGLMKDRIIDPETKVHFKLEIFQHTGTFKIRGAYSFLDHLKKDERDRGIVAATGGNHGMAVAYAAKTANIQSTIVAPKSMNPFRKKMLGEYGAKVVTVDTITEAFTEMGRLATVDGLTELHPFEGPYLTLGTATLGMEIVNQVPDVEAVIVPIGGGGLASGIASAVKKIYPKSKVYGVEPALAHSMCLSLDAGKPVSIPGGPKSIADSLCAPYALPYSFSLCEKYLDDVVLIEDREMRQAMRLLFKQLKIAVEPAGAAATAALLGPLKKRCQGKTVCSIVCGSNIDHRDFSSLISSD